MTARILSVNVGATREVIWRDRIVATAIWKYPVEGRVALRGVNFDGDDQADRSVHGGPDKAVYAYAQEDYDWWRDNEQMQMEPALFGENLTTQGVDLSSVIVGQRWLVGTTELEVAQPRLPCFKLGIRVGDPAFLKRFQHAGRLGAYLRVVREGDVGAGDMITIGEPPQHGITLRDMAAALDDEDMRERLRTLPCLPGFWKRVAYER